MTPHRPGSLGAEVLRRPDGDEVAIVTLTLWDVDEYAIALAEPPPVS